MGEQPHAPFETSHEAYRAGDLLIDLGRQRVTRAGEDIALGKLSYDLLMALVRDAPNLVGNDALMEAVWPKAVVSPETLSQRVKLLRDALGDNPRAPRYVEGLRGRGYRLIPPVERVAPAAPAADVPVDPGQARQEPDRAGPDQAVPAVPSPPARRRRWLIVASLATVCAVALVIGERGRLRTGSTTAQSSVEVVAVQPKSVAVLPFDNLSADAGDAYIAVGVAESVLNRLGSQRDLLVIARSSSFALGRPRPDAREAGRRLGVDYLVEGSVQRAGRKLRVNAQLIDAARNVELWSVSFDRAIDDVFAIQDEISQSVADKLEAGFHPAPAAYARQGTDAYLEFLQGRALMDSRAIADVEASIGHFTRALALAPAFAEAMTDLAYEKLLLASLRETFKKQSRELLPELKALADRAIQLDPAAGPAYYLRAQLATEDREGAASAEADFRTGYRLAPNDALGVYNFGGFLRAHERYEEALALTERASLLDPLAPSTHYLRGELLRTVYGDRERAAAAFQQALVVAPKFYPALTRLGMVRFNEGRLAEAIRLGEQAIAVEPKVAWTRETLIWFYVHLDDVAAARDVLRGFEPGYPGMPLQQALICYRVGDLARAERLARDHARDPDADLSSIAVTAATEAVVERAVARNTPAEAREFIRSIPGLTQVDGRIAVDDNNWPYFIQVAALERGSGNTRAASELSRGILDYVERSRFPGPPGVNDWTRASALAILGRADESLTALEHMRRVGNRMRWWETLRGDPSFASVRDTPRFQAIVTETQAWLASEQRLVQQLRERGEIPRRAAPASPGGC